MILTRNYGTLVNKITQLHPDMPWRLEPVEAPQLGAVWEYVGAGVAVVKRRTGPAWTPEHIFTALFNKQAFLYLAKRGDLTGGFVVLLPQTCPYTGDKILVLWVCYASEPGAVDECLPLVEADAKAHGVKKLVFQSPRRAWGRRLAPQGYREKEYIFEKELS